MPSPLSPDVLIAGAGLIGLSLALELDRRGARVTVLDVGPALGQASSAAAGMLAADDPHNPPALACLSRLSIELYPAFLERVSTLSGLPVPIQTDTTFQYASDGSITRLAERSLDPRQLAAALRGALPRTNITLQENLGRLTFLRPPTGSSVRSPALTVQAADGREFQAPVLVHTSGSWAASVLPDLSVTPRKGQMLRIALPASLPLHEVHRSATVYIVPRRFGPQAGSALLGATVEDAGFDLTTHPADLEGLRRAAARLLPELADATAAPQLEAWAGLRPSTPDLLPLLGRLPASAQATETIQHLDQSFNEWVATGHFRNGILLAPATAAVMADLLENRPPAVPLLPFFPGRFLGSKHLPVS